LNPNAFAKIKFSAKGIPSIENAVELELEEQDQFYCAFTNSLKN